MKLITEFYDLSEAENVSSRMRQAGVMTVVTSKKSYSLSRVKTGAMKVGLWAVLDEQYQDAVKLLEDKNHKPSRALSLSEMNKIRETASALTSMNMKSLIEKTAAWMFGGVLLALIVYVAIGLINDA